MKADIERLRATYEAWSDSKGQDINPWLDLVDDEFVLQSVAEKPDALKFAGSRTGPESLKVYFSGLAGAWSMESYTVDTLIGDGEEIAMFGHCSWTFDATGKTVWTPVAHLWRFRNGRAVSCLEIFDSAKVAEAAIPG